MGDGTDTGSLLTDQEVWTEDGCFRVLIQCFCDMWIGDNRANIGRWEFDKDDRVAMRFVTAASNLRSLVFSIAPLSLYEVKGIAGNIIPAIATTNAITAGLQVMEALKILGR